jgi:hypothetical protein
MINRESVNGIGLWINSGRGMEADETDFVPLDSEEIIDAAKKEKAGNAS